MTAEDAAEALLDVVLDTNVLVAALRSRQGASFRLLERAGRDTRFRINVSVPLILEYEDVLKRPGVVPHGMVARRASDVGDLLDYLCLVAGRCRIFFLWRPYLRDPQDDMVLEVAVEAECRFIVTFNGRDFGGVEQFGLRVVTPQELLSIIGERHKHPEPETA